MAGVKKFVEIFGDGYPKATKCLPDDLPELLAFFDYPAAHQMSIRTTNSIESAFSTIRNRTKLTREAMNRQGTVTMVFKLSTETQKRWRRINGYSHWPTSVRSFRTRTLAWRDSRTSPKLPPSRRPSDAPIPNY